MLVLLVYGDSVATLRACGSRMVELLLTWCRIGVQVLIDHAVVLPLNLDHSGIAATVLVYGTFLESTANAIVRAPAPATV